MDRSVSNLATIQRVAELYSIEGADKIECAKVLGWQCVVKRGDFKLEDLAVYIEIDSVLPDKPVFDFMRDRKFRVKTIKLRGVFSQGLLLPLSSFPEIKNPKEGQDVTKLLGIVKYDPPEVGYSPDKSSKSKVKPWWFYIIVRIPFLRNLVLRRVGEGSAFPSHLVPKTDETRVQAFGSDFLQKFKDIRVSVSQKMDGTSVTIIWHKNKLSVASRNVWFPTFKSNVYWNYVKGLGLEKVLKRGASVAIQGELCGPAIQGNKYKLDKVHLFVFGAYDIEKKTYFTPEELRRFLIYLKICMINNSILGSVRDTLHLVDTLADDIPLGEYGSSIDELIAKATSRSKYNEESWNEGIVIRSMDNKPYGTPGMCGRRFSFKVISPEFLLQYGL